MSHEKYERQIECQAKMYRHTGYLTHHQQYSLILNRHIIYWGAWVSYQQPTITMKNYSQIKSCLEQLSEQEHQDSQQWLSYKIYPSENLTRKPKILPYEEGLSQWASSSALEHQEKISHAMHNSNPLSMEKLRSNDKNIKLPKLLYNDQNLRYYQNKSTNCDRHNDDDKKQADDRNANPRLRRLEQLRRDKFRDLKMQELQLEVPIAINDSNTRKQSIQRYQGIHEQPSVQIQHMTSRKSLQRRQHKRLGSLGNPQQILRSIEQKLNKLREQNSNDIGSLAMGTRLKSESLKPKQINFQDPESKGRNRYRYHDTQGYNRNKGEKAKFISILFENRGGVLPGRSSTKPKVTSYQSEFKPLD